EGRMILELEERLPSSIQALDSKSTRLSPWIFSTHQQPKREEDVQYTLAGFIITLTRANGKLLKVRLSSFYITDLANLSSSLLLHCRKFYDMRSASKVFDEMSERYVQLYVIVAGLEHRFCQQCIRFHGLPELDGKNQRCRKQLADHNARRQLNSKSYAINDLKAQLVDKQIAISKLQKLVAKLKGKSVDTNFSKQDLTKLVTPHLSTSPEVEKNTKVLAPGMFRIDSEPINTFVRNNKLVHRDYINFTKEHTITLQELLEHARALRPSDENLDYACKFVKRIQELLVLLVPHALLHKTGKNIGLPQSGIKRTISLE
ncbi:retrovirus-related pol polyprotein from transposon TNT 1-94, partial [Tanacetum coccineum]